MNLTEHFTLEELTASDTAIRMGIDNSVPPALLDNLKRTAEMGEAIRAALSTEAGHEIYIVVSSGYRCEALEKTICWPDFLGWSQRHDLKPTPENWQEYFKGKAHPKAQAMDFLAPMFGDPFHIVRELSRYTNIMAIVDQLILEGVTPKTQGWVHAGWSETPRHQIRTAVFDANGTPSYYNYLT